MSCPFTARPHSRPADRFDGALTRAAACAVVVCLALVGAGCTTRPEAVSLGSPDDGPPAPAVAEPSAVEAEAVGTIEEEPLLDDAPIGAGMEDDGVLSVEPPALAETIGATTAPNVAAATRLVDAGRARMAAGDSGAALEQFERAIAIDPQNPYAYYYLAELHFLHRTYDQTIAFAARAASLSDAGAPDWASRAYTLQGNAFEAAGRFADARGAYARAIQAAPGNLAAQVGLARVGAPPATHP
jgi:Flp pilus assembly protein TadD